MRHEERGILEWRSMPDPDKQSMRIRICCESVNELMVATMMSLLPFTTTSVV